MNKVLFDVMNSRLMKIGLTSTSIILASASLFYFLNPFQTALEQAEMAKVRADISALSLGLVNYKRLNGFLPSTSQGLQALVTKPAGDPVPKNWLRCMIKLPTDPWGDPYRYALPGKHNRTGFDLYSTGGHRNRVIGNWQLADI